MKRTGFKPRTEPMKRSGYLRRHKRLQSAGRIKYRRKPLTPIQASAKGEECTMKLLGVCNYNWETTVLCHSNKLEDGKGMGIKSPDTRAAYGCSACHAVVDGRAPRPAWLSYVQMLAFFERAIEKTQAILRKKGLVS